MKRNQLPVAIVLGFFLPASFGYAQTQTCNATVTKRSVAESESQEKTWDIIFDIAAPACDNSRGQFEYVVELAGSQGRLALDKKTAEFSTQSGQRTAITVSYQAKSGEEVRNVGGITLTSCSCVKPGN